MNLSVDAVVVINPDEMDWRHVPYGNFDRMLYNLENSGLYSVCTREYGAQLSVSVDYMSNPEFRSAMQGYAPVVQWNEIENLSPLAQDVKNRIDTEIRGALQQAQVWSATGASDVEIFPYTPFSPLAGDHRRATHVYAREGRIGDGCP